MLKKILIAIFIIFVIGAEAAFAQKTNMEKFQKGADIYFKITDALDLNLNQQRKAIGIKIEETFHLAPLIEDIKRKEMLLESGTLSSERQKELQEELALQKAAASQKKRYYVARYRSILDEEQNHKLDELIFDLANGYLKL